MLTRQLLQEADKFDFWAFLREREPRTVYRSAVTGRFVSKAYAEAHPDTTIKQAVDGA